MHRFTTRSSVSPCSLLASSALRLNHLGSQSRIDSVSSESDIGAYAQLITETNLGCILTFTLRNIGLAAWCFSLLLYSLLRLLIWSPRLPITHPLVFLFLFWSSFCRLSDRHDNPGSNYPSSNRESAQPREHHAHLHPAWCHAPLWRQLLLDHRRRQSLWRHQIPCRGQYLKNSAFRIG